jgi:hypothetical protein
MFGLGIPARTAAPGARHTLHSRNHGDRGDDGWARGNGPHEDHGPAARDHPEASQRAANKPAGSRGRAAVRDPGSDSMT